MFLANKLNKGGSLSSPDAQFNYVTMLLHGDGTNGAQNNTFLDSSTNNFTITRNGNTTQGSFSPYGSNWSNYFDGSGDYLSVANNANLNLGSGDFTFECWIFPTSANGIIWSQWNNGGDNSGYLYLNGTNFQYRIGGTTYSFGSFSTNTWTHVAVSRSGSSVYLFVNGSLVSTQTNSTNITTTGATVLGANDTGTGGANFFTGYISNFRQVKGTAVYTSGFTPSTTPLTAVTNTQLLTCQSNRFKDNSTNNFTVTTAGNVSVQRFNPFGASTAYSTSVIGGSGYFDGSGDYLTTPSSITLGSGDLTIEGWFYPANTAGSVWFDFRGNDSGSAGNNPVIQWSTVTSGKFTVRINGTAAITSSSTFSINAWYHVALVRSGTTVTLYVNGSSQGTYTTSTSFAQAYSRIGAYGGDGSLPIGGYSSDMRAVVGTAVYTSTFTPPTAPLTAVSGTALLLNFTNGSIYDNAMMNDLETVGNAQISTSVKKYGTGSLAFDGTGDYLKVPASPNLIFGTGDFTIECWIYVSSNPAQYTAIVSNWAGADPAWILDFSNGSGNIRFNDNGNVYLTSSSTLTTGQWNHVAVSRSGTSLKMFFNGTSVATATNSTSFGSASAGVFVGAYYDGTYALNGYIDDLRITKGYARYTANFTPPTAAFPNTGPV